MGVFEQFPYVNMHEMNLQWLLEKMRELDKAMETFKATESLKFADPIIWDITTQYEKSTIVLDPTGNAYLSLQPVPTGIQLNNDEYWLEIFNFTNYTRTANQNLTVHTETNTTRATAAYQVDDWLIWNDVLYRVTSPIAIDDALIVAPAAGSNIVHFTVEDFIKAFITYATGLINQYKNDIDASELAYRQQLAQDIANTTASLTVQLNQAIAGATVDSEVIDARIGWDNTVYSTLGEAIRSQISYIHDYYLKFIRNYSGADVDFNNFSTGWARVYGTTNPLHSPVADPFGFVITTRDNTDGSSSQAKSQIYIGFTDGLSYIRYSNYDGTYTAWAQLFDKSKIDAAYSNMIPNMSTMTGANQDFNAKTKGIYRCYGMTSPLNAPNSDPFGLLLVLPNGPTNLTQIFYNYNDDGAYIRYSSPGSWTSWHEMDSFLYRSPATGAIDFDNIGAGYRQIYNTTNPSHSPVADPYGFIMCFKLNSQNTIRVQIFMSYNSNDVWIRLLPLSGVWSDWNLLTGGGYAHTVIVNPGDNLYTKLRGVSANTHVIINAGTYDISSAMEAMADSYDSDIHIKSGCWFEGVGMPTIICNLSAKRTYNSLFKFDAGNGKLSGLNLICTNERYAIHDDVANNTAGRQWTHIIENCHVNYTGIVGSNVGDGRSVGGGLGSFVTNIVKDCIFTDTNSYPVHYHTNSSAINMSIIGASKVVIKDNYFVTGTARVEGLAQDLDANRDTAIMTGNRGKASFTTTNPNGTLIPYIWNNIVE